MNLTAWWCDKVLLPFMKKQFGTISGNYRVPKNSKKWLLILQNWQKRCILLCFCNVIIVSSRILHSDVKLEYFPFLNILYNQGGPKMAPQNWAKIVKKMDEMVDFQGFLTGVIEITVILSNYTKLCCNLSNTNKFSPFQVPRGCPKLQKWLLITGNYICRLRLCGHSIIRHYVA